MLQSFAPERSRSACSTHRSLKVGLQISMDYWWNTHVTLRGLPEVCTGALGLRSREAGW